MSNDQDIIRDLKIVLEQSTCSSISNSLRVILMDYLALSDDYPIDIKDTLRDINLLFDILRRLEDLSEEV